MKLCALLMALIIVLAILRAVAALTPLDSAQQDASINATLTSSTGYPDVVSSQTSFNPTQYSVIRLDSLWINCGINNEGATASIRVYLSLSSDAVVWDFEFRQVSGGWYGVASGRVNYFDFGSDAAVLGAGMNSYGGATGGTATGVNNPSPLLYPQGGGFISVVRVWVSGNDAQVYAGECQYGISYENAEQMQTQNVQPAGVDYSGYFMGAVILVVALFILVVVLYHRVRSPKHGHTKRCWNCSAKLPRAKRFCGDCGADQLEKRSIRSRPRETTDEVEPY